MLNEGYTLHERLERAQTDVAFHEGPIFPNSFSPTEITMGFPRKPWEWDWLTERLARTGPGCVVRLPLFYQLEPVIFRAARAAKCFTYINDRANMPVGHAALTEDGFAVVITTSDDAITFHQYLEERAFKKKLQWIIVSSLEDARTPYEFAVARSLQLIPGVPALEECSEESGMFHLAPSMRIDEIGGLFFLSGLHDELVPIRDHPLPATFSRKPCVCGREGFIPHA